MIKINSQIIEQKTFPDGTPLLRLGNRSINQLSFCGEGKADIIWLYENMEEALNLFLIVSEIREHYPRTRLTLTVPYFPNARMDRTENDGDVFTLKHFSKFINSLAFDKVTVLDPHSNVTDACLDRMLAVSPADLVKTAIGEIIEDGNVDDNNLLMFYPDEGAMKRYSKMFERPFAYAVKQRDWATGKIQGLDIIENNVPVKGKDFLIVDDICSKGGTFYYAAKALKEHDANKVFLYVSHCENTVFKGRLLDEDGDIERIYTTNSIFTGKHAKIRVFDEW